MFRVPPRRVDGDIDQRLERISESRFNVMGGDAWDAGNASIKNSLATTGRVEIRIDKPRETVAPGDVLRPPFTEASADDLPSRVRATVNRTTSIGFGFNLHLRLSHVATLRTYSGNAKPVRVEFRFQ